jgi:four helix bundle protein
VKEYCRFEDLEVWRDAFELSFEIYRASGRDAFVRDFALRDQIRRASISVSSNIAEGFESRTDPMFREYLGRAKASAGELRSQLYLARRVNHLDDETFQRLVSQASSVSRQIGGLIKYLDQCITAKRHTRPFGPTALDRNR